MGLFQACMRRRLPELAAEHLKHALPEPDLRRLSAHKALPLMKESEWFDSKWFWELMGLQAQETSGQQAAPEAHSELSLTREEELHVAGVGARMIEEGWDSR